MQWADLAQFLDSGVAMLGASADATGQPETFRIWGATAPEEGVVRVLVSADACRTFEQVGPGARMALLFTDIGTFRSLQVKGRALGEPRPPGPDEMACFRRYDELFSGALQGIGHPRRLATSIRPLAVYAVDVEVDQQFDQTPGPRAGLPA
ncbi:MAG: hypothetical protein JO291_01680 [Acidimicrobiia bacterium]|nr:hypothetical protein [Acidimicrobiia bacterium]